MSAREHHCPQCGAVMQCSRWIAQPGRRYMTMAACPEHGAYLVRIRIAPDPDGTLRVSRLVYESGSEAAKNYETQAARPRRARRRKKRGAAKPKQE